MKKLKTIAAALMVIVAATSCKKEKTTEPVATPVSTTLKLVKLESAGAYNSVTTYNYDAQGRFANYTQTGFGKVVYDYTNGYSWTWYDESNIKQGGVSNSQLTAGKITEYSYTGYTNSGGIQFVSQSKYTYDAEDKMQSLRDDPYIKNLEWTNGNITKMTQLFNGAVMNTTTADYYNDKPNKLPINLFEYWFFDHQLNSFSVNGKSNINLPKKITFVRPGSINDVYEYSYIADANGIVSQMTQTYTHNGGIPEITTYKFSYQ